ncbi:MAG TPA: hypothetical protein VK338_01155 [Candidatus Nitrosocosmicus sp.]|nr:hypothetical protein [Candidatus Nitrosocosmicus sp.]
MGIDTTQILLISAVTIMTIILTIVGIQLIFILRDVRILLTKVNNMVHDFEKLGSNFTHGYSEVLGFFSGVKNIFHLIDTLSKHKKK